MRLHKEIWRYVCPYCSAYESSIFKRTGYNVIGMNGKDTYYCRKCENTFNELKDQKE